MPPSIGWELLVHERLVLLAAHICAMESWMLAMDLVSIVLLATRFLMVVFF